MTKKEIEKYLKDNQLHVTAFGLRKGEITLKRSYYYGSKDKLAKLLIEAKALPNVTVVKSGTHFAPFKGGATPGSKEDSYVYVTITVAETPKPQS